MSRRTVRTTGSTAHTQHLRAALLAWALLALGYVAIVVEAWVVHSSTNTLGWTSMATSAAGLVAVFQSWQAWELRPTRP